MSLDLTAAGSFLKQRYQGFPEVKALGFQQNPLFAVLPKDSGGGGLGDKIPMRYASVNARSATFAQAQTLAASNASKHTHWQITYHNDYSLARITGKARAAARNDLVAFIRAIDPEIESAFASAYRSIERDLFGVGDGFLGVGDGAWTVASTTLTLTDASQAHNFEVGMEVGAAANNTSTPRTGTATITAIDRDAGTLTTDSNWSAQITSIANTDSIFPAGDYVSASDRLKLRGLRAWAPDTAPTAGDNFFGVDRSVDVQRLAGIRYDASGGVPLDEALVNAQSIAGQNGAYPNVCVMNDVEYRKLLNLLGAKKEYNSLPGIDEKGNPLADISFRTVMLHGSKNDIHVMPNPFCPYDRSFMFDLQQIKLVSMGEFPGILDDDGQQILRIADADGVECRIGGYAQLVTQNAGSIVNIKLA